MSRVMCEGVAMSSVPILEKAREEGWADEEIVRRVLEGDLVLFELLMRRHNQRVYRAIRSILRDDCESEDVMQETYVRAFEHLAQFEGRAQFSTWLTRIAFNEALKRLADRGRNHARVSIKFVYSRKQRFQQRTERPAGGGDTGAAGYVSRSHRLARCGGD